MHLDICAPTELLFHSLDMKTKLHTIHVSVYWCNFMAKPLDQFQ